MATKKKFDPFKLTKYEKSIEDALMRGEYKPVSSEKFRAIAEAWKRARKNTVISLRLNRDDLAAFKKKAEAAGVPYQSMISELIHHYVTH
jgi:predicted DNA binding CopG/RHH family protein